MGQALARAWSETDQKIVEMHFILGISIPEIADSLKVPRRLVKRTVEDPRTKELVKSARQKILERTSRDMTERVGHMVDGLRADAAKALAKTLEAEISPLHKAKPNQDRVALKVLQGTGDLVDKSETERGGITLSDDQFDRLLEGLSKADRVQAQKVDTGSDTVEEVDFEIMDD